MDSIIKAIPCPPPIQAVATPYLPPDLFSSRAKVSIKRVPVAANGCPIPTAPPLTLTFSISKPSSWIQATA